MATKKSTDTSDKPTSKTASKDATKTATKSAAKAPAKKAPATAAEKAAAPAKAATEKKQPTHEEISKLAHSYWKERGHHHGSHEDDWHRAEQELKSRF